MREEIAKYNLLRVKFLSECVLHKNKILSLPLCSGLGRVNSTEKYKT